MAALSGVFLLFLCGTLFYLSDVISALKVVDNETMQRSHPNLWKQLMETFHEDKDLIGYLNVLPHRPDNQHDPDVRKIALDEHIVSQQYLSFVQQEGDGREGEKLIAYASVKAELINGNEEEKKEAPKEEFYCRIFGLYEVKSEEREEKTTVHVAFPSSDTKLAQRLLRELLEQGIHAPNHHHNPTSGAEKKVSVTGVGLPSTTVFLPHDVEHLQQARLQLLDLFQKASGHQFRQLPITGEWYAWRELLEKPHPPHKSPEDTLTTHGEGQ